MGSHDKISYLPTPTTLTHHLLNIPCCQQGAFLSTCWLHSSSVMLTCGITQKPAFYFSGSILVFMILWSWPLTYKLVEM